MCLRHTVICHLILNSHGFNFIWLTWHDTRAWPLHTRLYVTKNSNFAFQNTLALTKKKKLFYSRDVHVGVATHLFESIFSLRYVFRERCYIYTLLVGWSWVLLVTNLGLCIGSCQNMGLAWTLALLTQWNAYRSHNRSLSNFRGIWLFVINRVWYLDRLFWVLRSLWPENVNYYIWETKCNIITR